MAKITGKGVAAVEALSSSEIDIRFPSMAQAERAEFPPHALWNKEQGGTSVDIKQIEPETMKLAKALLHSAIIASCEGLLQSKHYAQAVELSFKVVRDRLRELTGHEKGSDAFGKGRLYIKGAIAPHVDRDFNEGVKFLTMAIDMFRNEKSHTSEIGINELEKALQYLILSSLAMRLLDDAEIRSSLFSNGQ
ncbi:TIGR02391 family protein [Methylovirgula sp. HY1]|uniref:TIGR02391 family protein n=1 Tax=Methylovirgula sp. HY1 TaxID=2822761 RepID=UPI001C5B1445|nr:TIGR02391 family protein [Methylovirgula sp. HY1]